MTEISEDQRILQLVREEVARERAAHSAAVNALPSTPYLTQHSSEVMKRQDAALRARRDAAAEAENARLERVRKLAPKAAKAARELETVTARLAEAEDAHTAAARTRQELYDQHLRAGNRLARLQYGDDI